MLYIISFQSISCREASPASPRPHKGPPEGVSARAEGAGLHPVHTPLLRKEFSTVLRAVPRVGSLSGLWAGSDRSSGRAVSSVIPSIFHPVSHTLLSSALWPVFPSIFHPVSLTLLSSVLWPVPQNNSQAGPRGGLCHDHPAHRYISAIPACRTIQQSPSNRPLNGPRPVLATATLLTGTSVPFRRGKTVIYHPFATATLPTDTPAPSPRAEQSHNLSQTGPRPVLCHGHPAHKPLSAIPTCRTIQQSLSNRPLTGIRPVLATATLSTSTSEPSRRAEAVIYHSFATATLPTDTSVPSRRGKTVIYHPLATATLPTGTPLPSPRAEQSNYFSQTGL